MKKYKKLLNAGIISSAVLLTTWGINKITFLRAGMKDMLFCENKYQYSWRFGNIFYTKKGCGSPILLIHELKMYCLRRRMEVFNQSFIQKSYGLCP